MSSAGAGGSAPASPALRDFSYLVVVAAAAVATGCVLLALCAVMSWPMAVPVFLLALGGMLIVLSAWRETRRIPPAYRIKGDVARWLVAMGFLDAVDAGDFVDGLSVRRDAARSGVVVRFRCSNPRATLSAMRESVSGGAQVFPGSTIVQVDEARDRWGRPDGYLLLITYYMPEDAYRRAGRRGGWG